MKYEKNVYLLENGKKIYCTGILLFLVLFVVILPLFLMLQINNVYIINFFYILFVILLFISIITIFSGSAFNNLYSIRKNLPDAFILKKFDPIRLKVEIENVEETRSYTILYHASVGLYSFWIYARHGILLWTFDIPPEHYQIWTPLDKISENIEKDRYDFLDLIRPSGPKRLFSGTITEKQEEIVFDMNLFGMYPRFHKKAKGISSLRVMGLAKEHGTLIVIALLTQNADVHQMLEVMKLMKDIAQSG